jgi:hypothetical protein
VLAAALGGVILALTTITQGSCFDSSDPNASYCTSSSIIPAAAVPFVWLAYLYIVAVLVYLAIRPITRH